MKLTFRIPAFVAVLGLFLVGHPVALKAQTTNALAADAPVAIPTVKAKKSKLTEYAGNITSIDPTSNTITVAGSANLWNMTMGRTAIIEKNGKKTTLADFSLGDSVTGTFIKNEAGVLIAHALRKKTVPLPTATATGTTSPDAAPTNAVATPVVPATPSGQ